MYDAENRPGNRIKQYDVPKAVQTGLSIGVL
jgi:hypothetical protein